MKTVYLIGGTMGVGKSTVCRQLQQHLEGSVLLDGDWCWDAHPFQVTDETKAMVMENICFLLSQFVRCSAYRHVIFCWVMHLQDIINRILAGADLAGCQVRVISLLCGEKSLRARLRRDVASGLRTEDVIERSVARIPLYAELDTEKFDTDGKTVEEIVSEILAP